MAAAKEFGWSTIPAHIIEYLPSKETLENILYREKADFEWKTGLSDSIELTEVGRYAYLLSQITEHQLSLEQVSSTSVSLENVAKDWYKTIYLPFIAIIQRGRLAKAFPKRNHSRPLRLYFLSSMAEGKKKENMVLDWINSYPKAWRSFERRWLRGRNQISPR